MFKNLKASTTVLVLQLLLGGAVFAAADRLSWAAGSAAAAAILMICGVGGKFLDEETHAAALPALAAAVGVWLWTLNCEVEGIMAFLIAMLIAAVVVLLEHDRRESWLRRFIGILPVISSPLVLLVRLYDT